MQNSLINLAEDYDYPLLNIFLTMMLCFLWVFWFVLLMRIIGDVFRDDDLSGWAKAGWTVFVILLPYLGVFIYLIVRGRGMGERQLRRSQRQEEAFRTYAREGDAITGQAEELSRLAELKNRGAITASEYERAKGKVLGS
ncbi:SHOCT domain-containing protein [Streptomyces sp. NBC_00513]|uniref:SHOCT domain-containing protein n=1 Tax=unclassified Streptomyces TaxID=2593676 RepID=UPI002258E2DB|nr:SHOCT domain-containing protein [Streptomyces sp. NBC_00424]MCX5077502.1 SHOCT domain-containing protein [Streptomyces sp. NBC_00424]WUD39520.1 SHOCT domain-containing protein [Streptomyces sp. NBC_00513]